MSMPWRGWSAGVLAGALLAVGTMPARGAVLLSEEFADGQITSDPAWTVEAGSFTVGNAAQSTDNEELSAAAGSRMVAKLAGVPGDQVTVDYDFRNAGGSSSGGKTVYVSLIDDATGDGYAFQALLSRLDNDERDPTVTLRLFSTTDRGDNFDSVHLFYNDTYDGSNEYQNFRFEWDRTTGDLEAFFNGSSVGTYQNTTYTGFDRAVVSMGATGRLDGLSITDNAIPEPSTLALAAVGGLALLGQRKRRH